MSHEQLRGYKKKVEWEEKFSSRIPDVKKQLFYEKMSVNPLEVQDEWFNLLLAQFWQVFGKGWVSDYVRGWIEIFTVQLGLVTEVCDFGELPLQVRKLGGKKRTVFDGSQIKRDHPDDWIYDLDLHLELDTDELLIRLAYPVAGFNFPLYVDHMRLSGLVTYLVLSIVRQFLPPYHTMFLLCVISVFAVSVIRSVLSVFYVFLSVLYYISFRCDQQLPPLRSCLFASVWPYC